MLGIYCRISRLKDGNDLSIEDQKQKGMAKAKELDMPYQFYIDEGISGASEKIEDRPEFERFLGDVSTGKLTHVFAYDQSRFERNPQIRFAILKIFKDNEVVYHTAMDGLVDLNDPQAEFFGDLLSVINKYHVTTTKLKVKSALRVRAKEGKSKGILPYGYTKDENGYILIEDDEAEVVKRIFSMSLEGIGTRTIAQTFNEEGILTRYNKIGKGTLKIKNKYTGIVVKKDKKSIEWAPNTITSIIRNTFYKGERNYSGEVLEVPAIFTPNYWQKVNDHLIKNRNNTGKKVDYKYLLKGLIRCGKCGRNMYGKKRADGSENYYMCSSKRIKGHNCGNRSINIDKIEYLIWHNLFYEYGLKDKINDQFNFDEDIYIEINGNIKKLNKEVIKLGDERTRAIDLVIKGIISEDDIKTNLDIIDGKLSKLKTEIDILQTNKFGLENSKKLITKYKNKFEEFTRITNFKQKQKIINDFINNIIVTYNEVAGEYDIRIDFKVDVTPSYILANMNENNYIMTDDNDNEYQIGDNINIGYIPSNKDINGGEFETEYDDMVDEDLDNNNTESDDKMVIHLDQLLIDIAHPIVESFKRFISWRWQLSTTRRNFISP
jgi:site-specific DNA recombinase